MKKKKLVLDIILTLMLGAQMAYALIGEFYHEVAGLCMIALLALHHALNGGFHRKLFKGRYTPYRIALTVVDAAMLVIFITQGVSGLTMAKHVRVLNADGAGWARKAHLLGAYWGFCLCGIHAGLHMTGLIRRWIKLESRRKKTAAAVVALAAVAGGGGAFVRRGLPGYMTLKQQFVFFDYSEPLARFFIDYALILITCMALGALLGHGLQNFKRRKLL